MGLKYRSTNSLSRHGGLAELQDASVWKVPNLYVDERLLGLVNRESGFFCEERMSPFWGGMWVFWPVGLLEPAVYFCCKAGVEKA